MEEFRGMLSFRFVYIFTYNLFQFCGHTWILANTITRRSGGHLLLGGLCDEPLPAPVRPGAVPHRRRDRESQTPSSLPSGESDHVHCCPSPGLMLVSFQVMEKNILLLVVNMCEEIQRKPVVCLQFFLWNILDLLRYPHELLCVVATPPIAMLWTRYSLWIPVYTLSVINEGTLIYQVLTLPEPAASNCPDLHGPLSSMAYLPVLAIGAGIAVWQLLKERRQHLERWSRRRKEN